MGKKYESIKRGKSSGFGEAKGDHGGTPTQVGGAPTEAKRRMQFATEPSVRFGEKHRTPTLAQTTRTKKPHSRNITLYLHMLKC
jgi:hypothetical protein